MKYEVNLNAEVLGDNLGEVGKAIEAAVKAAQEVGVTLVVGFISPHVDYPAMQQPIASTEGE